MNNLSILITICLVSMTAILSGQFTRQDTLRGSITPEREWWDLVHYDLSVEVIPQTKTFIGSNTITYRVLDTGSRMQIDLQEPLNLTAVSYHGQPVDYVRDGNAYFLDLHLPRVPVVGSIDSVTVHYQGIPRQAVRAPWDGGISWKEDSEGVEFIATSCQGLGASVWWPCKDHMYDEVDSMDIRVEVPDHLSDVSNGRLQSIKSNPTKQTKTYHWKIRNPINNYGVNINIGNYVSWTETYEGEDGPLDLRYWVLAQDELKARDHFKEVPRMLDAFEYWFGPYPFYSDGYQLVQAPYLGMEHQSSVTYGNKFQQGYLGTDLSGTGWGMKFDFIIIHESGHEWYANNITYRDLADMWLHESFTNYSESLYLEYHHGKEAGQEYVRGLRGNIDNKKAIIGPYGVNYDHYPIDVYYKGANLLNTLRTVVDDDEAWRGVLRGMNAKFRHQTIGTEQMEDYMSEYLEIDLMGFFDQYLRDPRLPVLEYYRDGDQLHYCWSEVVDHFDMPLRLLGDGEVPFTVKPNAKEWQSVYYPQSDLGIDENYYIEVREVSKPESKD